MAQPDLLTIPFARDASPDMVNPIPDSQGAGMPPEQATWTKGFPYVTTIPLAAGGLPPQGQDFNGIYKAITEHIVYMNGGGMYRFSPAWVSEAGGYPQGAVLAANDGLSLWVSLQDANAEDFNVGTPTQWKRIAFDGLDAALASIQANANSRLSKAANLSDVQDPQAARENLGIFQSAFSQESASATLLGNQAGVVLVDAGTADVTITLPENNAALGVRDFLLRRTDNSGNRLVVQATGTDRIKFHTHLRAEGYPFLVLMGAGDYWHLRSDGAGNWWPVARRDDNPLGSYLDISAAIIPPGGYGLPTGTVQAAHYPWLLDYALASEAVCDVAERTPKDGRWSISADGQTIYLPSPGSAFRRPHDPAGTREMGSYVGDQMRNITAAWANDIGTRNGFGATGAGGISGFGSFSVGMPDGSTFSATATRSFDASLVVPTGPEFKPEDFTAYQLLKII